MKWREFAAYMSGLDGKTPLGRIISIRAEDDREVLKQFTPEQRRIRSEWRRKKAKKMSAKDTETAIETFKRMFIQLAGSMTERPVEESRPESTEVPADAENDEADMS